MKVKTQYSYKIDGIGTQTREAARIIQRSIRGDLEAAGVAAPVVPRIVQRVVTERVVR